MEISANLLRQTISKSATVAPGHVLPTDSILEKDTNSVDSHESGCYRFGQASALF
jgi:hypothetical protein